MKKIRFIIVLFLVSGYTVSFSQTTSKHTKENFKKLEWLVGTWNRANTKPGREAHERWEKTSSNEFRGYGVTTVGQDTAFVEKLRILIKDDNIYYVADVPENSQPVYFKLTEITDTGFVCENPDHDFPKKIAYHLKNNTLNAQISGDGKAMDFKFTKKE